MQPSSQLVRRSVAGDSVSRAVVSRSGCRVNLLGRADAIAWADQNPYCLIQAGSELPTAHQCGPTDPVSSQEVPPTPDDLRLSGVMMREEAIPYYGGDSKPRSNA